MTVPNRSVSTIAPGEESVMMVSASVRRVSRGWTVLRSPVLATAPSMASVMMALASAIVSGMGRYVTGGRVSGSVHSMASVSKTAGVTATMAGRGKTAVSRPVLSTKTNHAMLMASASTSIVYVKRIGAVIPATLRNVNKTAMTKACVTMVSVTVTVSTRGNYAR